MTSDGNKPTFDPIPLGPPPSVTAPPKPSELPSPFGPSVSKPPAPAPKPKPPVALKDEVPPTEPAKDSPSPVPEWLKTIFRPTKTKGIVGVAAASLLGGWYGVRLMFPQPAPRQSMAEAPPLPENPPPVTPNELLAISPPAVPVVPAASGSFMPPIAIPDVPKATASAPPIAIPEINLAGLATGSGSTAVSPPVPVAVSPTVSPPIPIAIPNIPTVPATGNVVPAGLQEPVAIPVVPPPVPQPVTPTGGTGSGPPISIPVLPDLTKSPSTPAASPPVSPPAAAPVSPPVSIPAPSIPSVSVPVVPSATGSVLPPTMEFRKPADATQPAPVKVPDPGNLAMPNLTGTPPAATPTVPPVVVPTTPAAGTPSPAVPTPDPFPLRPAGSTVSPTASSIPDSVTKTDFDVDLHYSRAGESFGTIAKKHYGDERYGTALASFNGTPGGAPDRIVQIPPFSVLKKYAAGGAIPAPAAVPVGTDRTMDWMPSTAGTVKTYTIPATTTGQGMTFKDIARAAYGTDQDWQRVFDLNPQFSAGAVLPPGTKVRLSSDAKVGQ